MKRLAKKLVAAVLGYQVRKLYKKNNFKVIGVVGSIGKTSTKLAIAQTLSASFKVQYQQGNYNDQVTVPLVFFGEETPSLFNPIAWLGVFRKNQIKLKEPYQYDVVVIEMGSDAPGQIQSFKSYLKLEIGVVTAITPEHMQFFDTLDAVAKEELAISDFSSLVLANEDLCDQKYLKNTPSLLTYGLKEANNYTSESKSQAERYSVSAAVAVAGKMGMKREEIQKGLTNIQSVPGRMQALKGLNDSTIIDDTYNASPAAVKLALDYLYKLKSSQKIAVLGNMNELGQYSEQAHKEIGQYCDPKQLDLVITIGPDANKFLAAAAMAKGCAVERFDSPYEAGDYLKPLIKKGAIILVKGSQNGVFAEETVKLILANQGDSQKLVRQSNNWLKIKQKAFKR